MNMEQNQQSSQNNRVYYSYGDLEIDLRHYIQNLNSNLNNFLDSRRNWSEGLKQAFREEFEVLRKNLQDLLDFGGPTTDYSANRVVFADLNGNIYSEDDASNMKGLSRFDVSDALRKYADRIGGAIAIRGYNRAYYDKLAEAQHAAELKAARQEERRKQAEEADAPEAFNPDETGFLAFLKSPQVDLYDGIDFRWDDIYDLDGEDTTNNIGRTAELISHLASYYNGMQQIPLDYSNSPYKSQENLLKSIHDAYTTLLDGYQPDKDDQILIAAGLDSDFLKKWFGTVSPRQQRALEALERRKGILNNTIALANLANLDTTSYLLKWKPFTKKDSETLGLDEAINALAKQVKAVAPTKGDDFGQKGTEDFLNGLEESALAAMLNGSKERAAQIIGGLLAYDKELKKTLQGEGIFLTGSDGLEYLDYRNPSIGVTLVYNPLSSEVYLKKLQDAQDSPIYEKLLEEIPDESISAKFLNGGEIGSLTGQYIKELQGGLTDKLFEHANARHGWNSQGSIDSNENFKMEYEDYARIATLATNIASMFMDPISGAFTGIGASLGDLSADLADESISGWQAAKNLAANAGLDLISLIPGGETFKIVRGMKGIADVAAKALAAYGIYDSVANAGEIIEGLKHIAKGDYTRLDFQNAAKGIMMLAAATRTGKSIKTKRRAKSGTNTTDSIGLQIKDSRGGTRDVILEGEDATRVRTLAKEGKTDDIKTLLKTYEGIGDDVELGTRFKGIPVETHFPVKLFGRQEGESFFRSPIKARTKLNTFEPRLASALGQGFFAKFADKFLRTGETLRKRPADAEGSAPRPTEASLNPQVRPQGEDNAAAVNPRESAEPEVVTVKNPDPEPVVEPEPVIEPEPVVEPEPIYAPEPVPEPIVQPEEIIQNEPFPEPGRDYQVPEEKAAKPITHALLKDMSKKFKSHQWAIEKFGKDLNIIGKHKTAENSDANLQLVLEGYLNGLKESLKKDASKKDEFKKVQQFANIIKSDPKYSNMTLAEFYGNWLKVPKNELGGVLEKFDNGGYISGVGNNNNNTTWEATVGKSSWDEIIQRLLQNSEYYKTVNDLQTEHAQIRQEASGSWDVNKAYKSPTNTVGNYQGKYQLEGYNDIAIWPNWARYDFSGGRGPNGRYESDRLSAHWQPDNLYAGITDDRRLLGRKIDGDDYGDGILDQKNALLKSLGLNLEIFLDKDNYYKLRPLANPANPAIPLEDSELEEPSFNDAFPAGPAKKPLIKTPAFREIVNKIPDLADYLRNVWIGRKNDQLTKDLIHHIRPFIQDPYEVHRAVFGDYRAQKEGEQYAAELNNMAAHPITSDAAQQIAAQFEARLKGMSYKEAANKQDNAVIRQTSELAFNQEKDNYYNRWKIAMENRKSIHDTIRELGIIKNAGKSTKLNNWNIWIMNAIKNAKDWFDERSELVKQDDLRQLAQAAILNPESLGIVLSPNEKHALEAVELDGMSASSLPEESRRYYKSARAKILAAEGALRREYLGLPRSPYRPLVEEGLDNAYVNISPANSGVQRAKSGGQITVQKIKEKMKNADRHQKNIHKQIDSLDKKLDRLSRSVNSTTKVAQLR